MQGTATKAIIHAVLIVGTITCLSTKVSADILLLNPTKEYYIENKAVSEVRNNDTILISDCVDTFQLSGINYTVNEMVDYSIRDRNIHIYYNNMMYSVEDIGIVTNLTQEYKVKTQITIEFWPDFPEVRGQLYKYLFKIKDVSNHDYHFLNQTYIWVEFEHPKSQVSFDEFIKMQRKQLPIKLTGELNYVVIDTYGQLRYDDNYTGYTLNVRNIE